MLLNNQWVIQKIKANIKTYLGKNENRNIMYQNVQDAAKAVPRKKFLAIQAYLRKGEKSQAIQLYTQKNQKLNKQNIKLVEINIKIRVEINGIET